MPTDCESIKNSVLLIWGKRVKEALQTRITHFVLRGDYCVIKHLEED